MDRKPDDPVRNIFIDKRMGSYEGYVPDDWSAKTFGPVKSGSALDNILVDLLLAWRTTAYTAAMPATAIKVAQATLLGYAKHVAPDASVVAFGDNIIAKLSRTIPELVEDRKLRAKLIEGLVTMAADFRDTRAKACPDIPIEPIWQDFLNQDAFAMSVWSSQRVTYVAFYNAYEAFLVECAKLALGVSQLRATDREFKEALRRAFCEDISVPCWMHHEMNICKLVRNALSHADGSETADLKKQKHGIVILKSKLQIVPDDNHKLLRRLRAGVEAMVTVAAPDPKFSAIAA
jgi:heme exporter protein D